MYAYMNPQNGEGNKDTKEEMPDAECFGLMYTHVHVYTHIFTCTHT